MSVCFQVKGSIRPQGGGNRRRFQSILGVPECAEEDGETWMTCDAEDCGFQMLNDDEIMTSVQEESIQVARVHRMLTRFLR
ncbi:hypothetical protein TNCV_867661 [Trichonephila clavipes]|nr:hypothetical protein TNCV_867661 [Trichonephila clavipes]